MIHPLHKKIRKTEFLWKKDREKYGQKFVKLKKKYMERVSHYHKRAKCTDWYAYTPNYIEDLKQPGPYFRQNDLYGEKRTMEFEGDSYTVPSNYETILEAFYGKNWRVSPFIPLENLKNEKGELRFNKKKFAATKMKHLSYFDKLS